MKYTYAVLEDTALGHLKPLPINSKVINSELDLPFKQILLTLIISTANASIYKSFGNIAVGISAVITAAVFPANVMVLAMEHSFFAAFNPVLVIGVIKRIGAPYFLLTFLLLILFSASGTIMEMLGNSVSYTNYILINSFINMYFTLIMFHLMGYVLYQYHDALGYNLEIEDDGVDKATTNPDLRTVEILIQEGKTKEANIKLALLTKENPDDHNIQMLNLKLQQLLGDMESYDKHAKKYISYLFSTQQITQAIKIILTIFSVNPSFKPAQAIERFELAKLLQQNGQNKAAVKLINNMHTDFPLFKHIPEAYFFASKILCEQLGNDKQAKAILKFLLQKYPEAIQKNEIKNYLTMINNLNDS